MPDRKQRCKNVKYTLTTLGEKDQFVNSEESDNADHANGLIDAATAINQLATDQAIWVENRYSCTSWIEEDVPQTSYGGGASSKYTTASVTVSKASGLSTDIVSNSCKSSHKVKYLDPK